MTMQADNNTPAGRTKTPGTTAIAVQSVFRKYYFTQAARIEVPDRIEEREFGYMRFGDSFPAAGGAMVRHLAFRSIGELVASLIRDPPADVFCSNAYYRFPANEMREKEWRGADLIFDIDGKDFDLPCVPSHSYLVCRECGFSDLQENLRGPQAGLSFVCPSCKASRPNITSLPCTKCIDASKNEAIRLVSLLSGDFGIELDRIKVYFSGNNGFHLHVSDDSFNQLDSQARSDIVGYLTGNGLMPESIGVRKAGDRGFAIRFPRGGISYGWRARVAKKLKIDASSEKKLEHIVSQKGGYAGFRTELERIAREEGLVIDPQVTTDTHRVFRMPGTLNSKSGLAKVRCGNIGSFDPFTEACLLEDQEIITTAKADVKVRLRGKTFRLEVKERSILLPAYAAVYLACKGLAELEISS
jgi:DNA primase small subunit